MSKCGFCAIVGRPNVGKSTLLNKILGQKISITSKKPQTTRHQIIGIKTEAETQIIYVDTPGMHLKEERAINRYMNRAAGAALKNVDVVVFMLDRTYWTPDDEMVLNNLRNAQCPVLLAVNKVDQIKNKESLLPVLEQLAAKYPFAEIVPISAEKGLNVEALEKAIAERIPESIHYYPDDQVTDRSSRFLAAELVREKVMRQLGEEVPYSVAVEIEEFREDEALLTISALILVERQGQKKIVIGNKGEQIKIIGRDARIDMQRAFGKKVMLNLWVKVKGGWADSERALKSLGYFDV